MRALALVPYRIECVFDAILKSLVTYVDSISASLLETGLIGCQAVFRLAGGRFHHTGRTSDKRVLAIGIGSCMVGKARLCRCAPLIAFGGFYVVALGTIVVDNDFLLLPVTLTRRKDNGASLLQHRDEVGHHNGLCVQVLCRSEEFGTLPAPIALCHVVEPAVTGP